MLYVTSSQAFRSGTFTAGPVAACGVVAYRRDMPGRARSTAGRSRPLVPPETLLNDELGFRSEWLDGRLRFNATYYEMEYTDRQGASAVAGRDRRRRASASISSNQGDVDLWGSEIEAMFAVTDSFTIEGATGRANYKMSNPCINNGPYLFPPPMDREHSLSGRYELPRPTRQLHVRAELHEDRADADAPGRLHARGARADYVLRDAG